MTRAASFAVRLVAFTACEVFGLGAVVLRAVGAAGPAATVNGLGLYCAFQGASLASRLEHGDGSSR